MTSTDHIPRIFSVFTCCSINVGGTDSENKISLNGNNVWNWKIQKYIKHTLGKLKMEAISAENVCQNT